MPTPSILEAEWITFPLEIRIAGKTVSGKARANWGAVGVEITTPIADLVRTIDRRGWCFAMAAGQRPELRYAFHGEPTEKGRSKAVELLTDLYLDWELVHRHDSELLEACRATQQYRQKLEEALEGDLQPLYEGRSALRKEFKSSRLSQSEYQRRLKAIRNEIETVQSDSLEQILAALRYFENDLRQRFGRAISLDETEKLLCDTAVVVRGTI